LRNIDKKWALFVIATVVSFYGICYTLINTTFAVEYDLPIDRHFEDMNFYKCVVDAYNLEFSTDVSYDQVLDYDKLKKLSILKCNKNENTLEVDKIMSLKGIELLVSLENVSLAYNNISKIDLSNNLRLLSLDISYNELNEVNLSKNKMLSFLNINGNTFVNDLYVYNGEGVYLKDNIKISSDLIKDDISWNTENKNIINTTFYHMAYAKDNGLAVVNGESSLGYKVINNIKVISISSDKYEIDEEKSYIYIDNLNNFNIQDIMCDDNNISLELYLNDSMLEVKYEDKVLKEFKLIETEKDV